MLTPTRYIAVLLAIAASSPNAALARVTVKLADGQPTVGRISTASIQDDDAYQQASWFTQPSVEEVEEEYASFSTEYSLPQNWATGEYLAWWTKGNQLPSLVTSSPAGTPRVSAGVLPAATTLFGNNQIDDQQRNGLRVSFGHWLDPDHMLGLQATYFGVFDDTETGDFTTGTTGGLGAGSGSPIIARPFYNVSLNQEDAELVSFPNVVDGTIRVNSSSELHSASVLVRQCWRAGSRGRIDLVQGYRYFRLREGLQIHEDLVSTDPGGLVPVGTTLTIDDQFQTANEFHGYELGLVAEFWRGYWSYEFLAKVALGRLHRSVNIGGSTVTDVPPAGGGLSSSGGLLALPTNIDLRSEDDFAALPEFGVNLKFEPRDNVTVQVGYTLLMLNGVIRTGEQIDRLVNPTQLSGGVLVGNARPASQFSNESDYWAQGINVGLTFAR